MSSLNIVNQPGASAQSAAVPLAKVPDEAPATPKPREWVTKNLYEGVLSDMDFALRLEPGSKPDLYLDFGFEKILQTSDG